MARERSKSPSSEEESSYIGGEVYEECSVCRQEFADGVCPIASAECPYRDEEDDVEDDEDEAPDFEDVENLKEVLDEDKEADRLTDEEADLPDEDLKDD